MKQKKNSNLVNCLEDSSQILKEEVGKNINLKNETKNPTKSNKQKDRDSRVIFKNNKKLYGKQAKKKKFNL